MIERDVVIWIGTGILFLAFPPALWFTVDYGLLTPRKRLRGERDVAPELRQYIPWWRSGIGIMWFGFGAVITLLTGTTVLSRALSQVYGLNWPGREWVTLASYTLVFCLVMLSTIVYAVERTTPGLILVGKARRAREKERAERIAELEPR